MGSVARTAIVLDWVRALAGHHGNLVAAELTKRVVQALDVHFLSIKFRFYRDLGKT